MKVFHSHPSKSCVFYILLHYCLPCTPIRMDLLERNSVQNFDTKWGFQCTC
jgi:hypothetical protein